MEWFYAIITAVLWLVFTVFLLRFTWKTANELRPLEVTSNFDDHQKKAAIAAQRLRYAMYGVPFIIWVLNVGIPIFVFLSKGEVVDLEILFKPTALFAFVYFTAIAVDLVGSVRSEVRDVGFHIKNDSETVKEAADQVSRIVTSFEIGNQAAQQLLETSRSVSSVEASKALQRTAADLSQKWKEGFSGEDDGLSTDLLSLSLEQLLSQQINAIAELGAGDTSNAFHVPFQRYVDLVARLLEEILGQMKDANRHGKPYRRVRILSFATEIPPQWYGYNIQNEDEDECPLTLASPEVMKVEDRLRRKSEHFFTGATELKDTEFEWKRYILTLAGNATNDEHPFHSEEQLKLGNNCSILCYKQPIHGDQAYMPVLIQNRDLRQLIVSAPPEARELWTQLQDIGTGKPNKFAVLCPPLNGESPHPPIPKSGSIPQEAEWRPLLDCFVPSLHSPGGLSYLPMNAETDIGVHFEGNDKCPYDFTLFEVDKASLAVSARIDHFQRICSVRLYTGTECASLAKKAEGLVQAIPGIHLVPNSAARQPATSEAGRQAEQPQPEGD